MHRWDWPGWTWKENITTYSRLEGQGHIQINNFVEDYCRAGKIHDAEVSLRQEIRDTGWNVSDGSRVVTLLAGQLGFVLQFKRIWVEAQELFLQVMETRKRVFGKDHPTTLNSMNAIAVSYRLNGQYQEAEELGLRTLGVIKGADWLNDHAFAVVCMHNLAMTYNHKGKRGEAARLLREALNLFQGRLGDNHHDILVLGADLADILRK